MNAPIHVTTPAVFLPKGPVNGTSNPEVADLLRQLIDIQKEQLAFQKAQAAASEGRWRAFLARWQTEYPDVGPSCRDILPILERAYLSLVTDLTERLKDEESEGLESEFALAEFLDRYGMRLGQLGTILSQIAPIADAATPPADDDNKVAN
jgi:hypothetical protein